MADTYSKLLGLSETNPPAVESGKTQLAQAPKQEVKKTSKPARTVTQPHDAEKSTKPQNRLSTIQSSAHDEAEKVEKYTTHLEPSLIKKVKHYAVEKEIKDYEVVKNALLFYFEQNKWKCPQTHKQFNPQNYLYTKIQTGIPTNPLVY